MKKPTRSPKQPAKSVKAPAKPRKVATPPARTPPPKPGAPRPAPAVRRAAAKPSGTVVTAQVDVGFGNSLYVRGEGAGLSWDQGLLMTCIADDAWSIKLPPSSGPVTFKFLLNDLLWSSGENYTVAAGSRISLAPLF